MLLRLGRSIFILQEGNGGGTGFSVRTSKGTVTLTNAHVCDKNESLVALTQQGEKLLKVLKVDTVRDLCVLEGSGNKGLELADTDTEQFDEVFTIGHPLLEQKAPEFGRSLRETSVEIATHGDIGEVECLPGERKRQAFIFSVCTRLFQLMQTTVRIFPGNSGSPIFNSNGKVVGVMQSADSTTNKGNYVPLRYLISILYEI